MVEFLGTFFKMEKLLPYNVAHYILGEYTLYLHRFKSITKRAHLHFEGRNWHGIQSDARERLTLYDKMSQEASLQVIEMMGELKENQEVWRQIQLMYAEDILNLNSRQLAETFYNSVFRHTHPGISADEELMFVLPSHESHDFHSIKPIYNTYLVDKDLVGVVRQILTDYEFDAPYQDLDRDVEFLARSFEEDVLSLQKKNSPVKLEIIRSVFYRNKGAYLIGRAYLGKQIIPVVFPLLHDKKGVYVDALITESNDLSIIFSYNRSYFLVDIDIPGEFVEFLNTIIPSKKVGELYNSIGLVKHGKTEIYRDFVTSVENSDDKFILAPGIKGMVMSVFTLPSYDMVFKLIKDEFDRPKDTTKEKVKEKYKLVSQHDRVGRMSDTHEFENFIFDRNRFSEELIEELEKGAPSMLKMKDDKIEISHLYIEKRMVPLNLFLKDCSLEKAQNAVEEYGNAIKQLAAVNIFPGDFLLKNFGVTRLNRVVFYDYDEIGFVTDYNFREIPESEDYYDELSAEPWYYVGENDIFPEEFKSFLIGRSQVRELFFDLHGDLFEVSFWKSIQDRLKKGEIQDVFPYRRRKRFQNRFATPRIVGQEN